MATFQFPVRRLIIAGGFVVAVAAAPVAAAIAVPSGASSAPAVAACANGESEDLFTGQCTPDMVPNSPVVSTINGGSLTEVDGIPCTGANSGQCYGLSENAVPEVVPHSSVSSSP
ncbi:intersectin-EH binding protein Ibp1 [Mycobacterium sp.]|jgi:hypothetical protein|uniref:intersectin-EH binding protein Ibp1 n=1 Tax=Mycobacterium sp. TaxID=1785 RepID=UPI0033415FC8|nr:hypothetical protein [Mycobacterium sp.]